MAVEFQVGTFMIEVHEAPDRNLSTDHVAFPVDGGRAEIEAKRRELTEKGIECVRAPSGCHGF